MIAEKRGFAIASRERHWLAASASERRRWGGEASLPLPEGRGSVTPPTFSGGASPPLVE